MPHPICPCRSRTLNPQQLLITNCRTFVCPLPEGCRWWTTRIYLIDSTHVESGALFVSLRGNVFKDNLMCAMELRSRRSCNMFKYFS
ncbi:unnamed protein product [Victoria cruziana]